MRGATTLALRTALFAVLSVARVALVARLLGPAELGLFGVLTIVAEAARALTSVGATTVVIQRESIGDRELATYWAFRIIQCFVSGVIVFAITPFAVDATLRVRALKLGFLVALSIFLPGMTNPGRVVAEREARFERVSLMESIAAMTELVVVLAVAVWLRSAAALAFGTMARAAVELALSFTLFPVTPRPAFHREPAREYLRASAHFVAMSAGAYVMIYGDNLTIANQLGAVALGFYVAAHRLTELAFSALTSVTNRVVFPVLSRLQKGDPRFLRAIAMLMELQLLYLAVVAVGLAGFAAFFVHTFYGPTFAPAAVVLQALTFVTIGRATSRMVTPIVFAAGRYDFESKVKGFEAGVFVLGVVIGVKTAGIVGVALGAGAGYTVAAALRLEFLRRRTGVPGRTILRMVATSFGLAVAALAVGLELGHLVGSLGRWTDWVALTTYLATFALLVLVVRGELIRATLRLVRGRREPSADGSTGKPLPSPVRGDAT